MKSRRIIVIAAIAVSFLLITLSSSAFSNGSDEDHSVRPTAIAPNGPDETYPRMVDIATRLALDTPPSPVVTQPPQTTVAEDPASNNGEAAAHTGSIKGVILFLSGGIWETYFVKHALPRLEHNFLKCFPFYPVHIFHEKMPLENQQKIRALVPSAPHVDFEDVSQIWKTLPAGISEAQLKIWMNSGVQAKFQGRGYRIMCRFWSGLAWILPSMDKYDYYWRLDTDSIIAGPAKIDPFRWMVDHDCSYGYNRLKGENPHVLTELWPTYKKWLAETDSISAEEKETVRTHVEQFALDPKTGAYNGPMYYNNFELGTFALKRHVVLQDMFRYFDTKPPHGFLKFRWGDAPWHTLAVHTVLKGEHMCNISKELLPYRHAARKVPPMFTEAAGDKAHCPKPSVL